MPVIIQGKVVLVERGLCDFSQKAINAQHQGALAIVIQNFEENLITMALGNLAQMLQFPAL